MESNTRRHWHNVALVVLALVVLGGGGIWHLLWAAPSSEDEAAVRFEVPRGASARAIAERLEKRGLIRSELGFRLLLRLRGQGADLRAGEFPVSPSMSAFEVIHALTRGPVWLYQVTLPEGWTAREMAARLE